MAMLNFERKYRVRGGTLLGGDLFDFWIGPFYVGLFGVLTIFFTLIGVSLILYGVAIGPTWSLWRLSINPPVTSKINDIGSGTIAKPLIPRLPSNAGAKPPILWKPSPVERLKRHSSFEPLGKASGPAVVK